MTVISISVVHTGGGETGSDKNACRHCFLGDLARQDLVGYCYWRLQRQFLRRFQETSGVGAAAGEVNLGWDTVTEAVGDSVGESVGLVVGEDAEAAVGALVGLSVGN